MMWHIDWKSNIVRNTKAIFKRRRIELILIDTGVFLAVNLLMWAVSQLDVSSLMIDGAYTFPKAALLWICIFAARCIACIYSSIWRYADVNMYLKQMIADMAGGIIFFLIGRLIGYYSFGFAYSVLVILAVMLATLFSRFAYQFWYAYAGKSSDTRSVQPSNDGEDIHKINVIIVGAGNVGATLANELIRNPKAHYRPYCFVDNDVDKVGSEVNGLRVIPENDQIVDVIKSLPVQEIIIAIPDASAGDKARLYELYKQTDCRVKLYDYPVGDVSDGNRSQYAKRSLRDFRIEDLLFRDALKVKSDGIRDFYEGKTVLVTGGGGSIGSELCRQIAAFHPAKLIILDIYENNAYVIQQELIRTYGERDDGKSALNLETVIASVRDRKRMDELFDEMRPQIVFHAAAHKHVPLMEDSGCEAIKNNVLGTYNVADMAEKYGVEKFVLISTDKAVNPTNIMGASKRLCEMVIQCRKDSKTEFAAVRFGNVLGSNGSVIPLFKKQIEVGGPITLTDKRVIRYFMTIPEAVGLVLEAGAMARNGELFVLDMGNPVKILDLAENMIRLSGMKPYEDIDIVEIGLRPGEKLYEELLMKSEELDKTDNEMIFIERDKPLSRQEVERKLEVLEKAIGGGEVADGGYAAGDARSRRGYHDSVWRALKAVVPTFREPEEVNKRAGEADEMQLACGECRSCEDDMACAADVIGCSVV